jgi:hypothetical protein
MSETATQLLNAFASLSAEEQHEEMLALLRKSGELPGSAIASDAEIAHRDFMKIWQ